MYENLNHFKIVIAFVFILSAFFTFLLVTLAVKIPALTPLLALNVGLPYLGVVESVEHYRYRQVICRQFVLKFY